MCEPSKFEPLILPPSDHFDRVAEARQLGTEMIWVEGWPEDGDEAWVDLRKRGARADA